jgi:hypothetical protein
MVVLAHAHVYVDRCDAYINVAVSIIMFICMNSQSLISILYIKCHQVYKTSHTVCLKRFKEPIEPVPHSAEHRFKPYDTKGGSIYWFASLHVFGGAI